MSDELGMKTMEANIVAKTNMAEPEAAGNQSYEAEPATTDGRSDVAEAKAAGSQSSEAEAEAAKSQSSEAEAEAAKSQSSEAEAEAAKSQSSEAEATESQSSGAEAAKSQSSETEAEAAESQNGAAKPEATESMDDYAAELEASFKEYDEKRSRTYVEEELPDASKWQELKQMQDEKTVVKVKIKEIVKGGAIAYVEEMKAFIPASQLSLDYVEKLEEWVGTYIEVRIITVDPERKKLVLSARELLKERREEEKAKRLEVYKAGDIVEGVVDSIKPYGAFIVLEDGLSGLLHISQISTQRIKHPSVVLKEGQKVMVKLLSVTDGKISLSMKALEEAKAEAEARVDFDYKGDGAISTGLGDLLKGFKL